MFQFQEDNAEEDRSEKQSPVTGAMLIVRQARLTDVPAMARNPAVQEKLGPRIYPVHLCTLDGIRPIFSLREAVMILNGIVAGEPVGRSWPWSKRSSN